MQNINIEYYPGIMKTLSGFIYYDLMGWKTGNKFPDIKKSVAIFVPHTSNWDSFIGKLYLNIIGLKYNVLAKKELFVFPLNILFRAVRAIPIDRKKANTSYVDQIAELMSEKDEIHIIIAPEGTRKKVAKWKKGFYYIARKANVPIVALALDYKKKEIGVKGVITDLGDIKKVMQQLNEMYKDVNAKYPENFSLNTAD